MKKVVHCKLGSRAEGVAFLCKNWDFKRKKLTNALHIDGPLRKMLRLTDFDDKPVTCPRCLRAMK